MLNEAEKNCLLQKRADYIKFRNENVGFIPISSWGFDENVKKELREMKHKRVDTILPPEKKQTYSKAKKQQLARGMDLECRTVPDVLAWIASQDKNNKPAKSRTKDKQQKGTDRKFEDALPSTSSETATTADQRMAKMKRKTKEPLDGKNTNQEAVDFKSTVAVPAEMLEGRELVLQKLQAKVEELKALRKGKRTAEQYEQRRKVKRRISKLKMKERRRIAKQKQTETFNDSTAIQAKRRKIDEVDQNTKNSEEKLVFSKFDFIVRDEAQKTPKIDKRDKFAGKDYKRLLEKAEKRAKRIEKIRTRNPEKAAKIEDNIQWKKAMDNVELLKKSLQKKKKLKEWRKRKWEKRIEHTEKMQAKIREKRTANIQSRKDAVKKKKLQKARKKGRIL